MGCFPIKKKKNGLHEKDLRVLVEKIMVLELEINETLSDREKDSGAFKKEVMVFACKEAEWKEERKRLRAKMKSLRKMLKEKDGIVLEMESGGLMEEKKSVKNGDVMGSYRDETVEKWKQLYLAIKFELDHLIRRIHGDSLYWRSKEDKIMEELNRELKYKEDIFQALREQVDTMERKQHRSKTEVDILRQSLRILSN